MLSFVPFIAAQARPPQVQFQHWLIDKMVEVQAVAPADLPKRSGNSFGMPPAVVISGEVDDARVNIDSQGFAATVIFLQDVSQELGTFDLKRTGETRRQAEGLWIFPCYGEAAN